MVARISYMEEYLEETKRDCFFLQLVPASFFQYDEDSRQEHLAWLTEHGVNYYLTVGSQSGLLAGDPGCYYLDFNGWDDPLLKKYCDKFESNNQSLAPDKYRIVVWPHDEYVSSGDREKYLQHLTDLQDPDYNP